MTKISRSEGLNLFIEVDACKNQTSEVNYLEHVQLTIRIRYSKRGDLQIRLTSPGGRGRFLIYNYVVYFLKFQEKFFLFYILRYQSAATGAEKK